MSVTAAGEVTVSTAGYVAGFASFQNVETSPAMALPGTYVRT